MLCVKQRLQDEATLLEIKMDTQEISGISAEPSAQQASGCCGGKHDSKATPKVEAPIEELARDTPASSGCRCGQN